MGVFFTWPQWQEEFFQMFTISYVCFVIAEHIAWNIFAPYSGSHVNYIPVNQKTPSG